MVNRKEQTESAIGVAWAIFDFFQVVGDEIVFDIDRAINVIEEFGERRVREAWRRPRRGKVVPLRAVRR
jgi:hypothetical protein